jgi:hypothetical protein
VNTPYAVLQSKKVSGVKNIYTKGGYGRFFEYVGEESNSFTFWSIEYKSNPIGFPVGT